MIRQVGNDISVIDLYLAVLHGLWLRKDNPVNRLLESYKHSTSNTIKIGSSD